MTFFRRAHAGCALTLAVLSGVLWMAGAQPAAGCSTFVLERGPVHLVGHNLDETPGFHVPGLLCVNKRGVKKEGITWADLVTRPEGDEWAEGRAGVAPDSTLSWVSTYGSVTFNTDGLEFPDGGVNEAGLVVFEMSLPRTRFPSREGNHTLFMSSWIQYQLDNCEAVGEVVVNAHAMNLDGWQWHFLVADATGDCAVIEFVDEGVQTYSGEDLPVPALCNAWYPFELGRLARYDDSRFMDTLKRWLGKTPRFVKAARMIEYFAEVSDESSLDYAWEVLAETRIRGWNKWSILVDVPGRTVYFNTEGNREIRYLSLEGIDFSCDTPAQVVDVHESPAGDVSGELTDYSYESNLEFIQGRADILFVERLRPLTENGVTAELYARRFAAYPERTLCTGTE